MASKNGIVQQGENLDTLSALVDLVKNPKLITEAQKEYRSQIALTEAEESKAKEARDYISKHADLVAKLEKERSDFATEKSLHENNVSQFKEQYDLRKNELDNISANLDAKSKKLDESLAAHESDKNAFVADKKAFDDNYQFTVDGLTERSKKIDAQETKNQEEAQRLAVLRTELQQKADNIRKSVTDF